MKTLITIIFATLIPFSTLAHEGHNMTPGSINAPHGGQIKGTKDLYIELVSNTAGFKIYPFDHDLKSVPLKDVQFEIFGKLPKQNKADKLIFKTFESYLEAQYDAKGSHRYIVDIKIAYKGKNEKVSFNVESQE